MGVSDWDPAQYGKFAAERAQPFWDLVGLIEQDRPIRARRSTSDAGPASSTAAAVERLGVERDGRHRFVAEDAGRRAARAARRCASSAATWPRGPRTATTTSCWPTPACSGCPTTSACSPAGGRRSPRMASSPCRCPPTPTTRRTASPPRSRRASRSARRWAARPRPTSPRNVLAPEQYAVLLDHLGARAPARAPAGLRPRRWPASSDVVEWVKGTSPHPVRRRAARRPARAVRRRLPAAAAGGDRRHGAVLLPVQADPDLGRVADVWPDRPSDAPATFRRTPADRGETHGCALADGVPRWAALAAAIGACDPGGDVTVGAGRGRRSRRRDVRVHGCGADLEVPATVTVATFDVYGAQGGAGDVTHLTASRVGWTGDRNAVGHAWRHGPRVRRWQGRRLGNVFPMRAPAQGASTAAVMAERERVPVLWSGGWWGVGRAHRRRRASTDRVLVAGGGGGASVNGFCPDAGGGGGSRASRCRGRGRAPAEVPAATRTAPREAACSASARTEGRSCSLNAAGGGGGGGYYGRGRWCDRRVRGWRRKRLRAVGHRLRDRWSGRGTASSRSPIGRWRSRSSIHRAGRRARRSRSPGAGSTRRRARRPCSSVRTRRRRSPAPAARAASRWPTELRRWLRGGGPDGVDGGHDEQLAGLHLPRDPHVDGDQSDQWARGRRYPDHVPRHQLLDGAGRHRVRLRLARRRVLRHLRQLPVDDGVHGADPARDGRRLGVRAARSRAPRKDCPSRTSRTRHRRRSPTPASATRSCCCCWRSASWVAVRRCSSSASVAAVAAACARACSPEWIGHGPPTAT